jgi:hypothetical protein
MDALLEPSFGRDLVAMKSLLQNKLCVCMCAHECV